MIWIVSDTIALTWIVHFSARAIPLWFHPCTRKHSGLDTGNMTTAIIWSSPTPNCRCVQLSVKSLQSSTNQPLSAVSLRGTSKVKWTTSRFAMMNCRLLWMWPFPHWACFTCRQIPMNWKLPFENIPIPLKRTHNVGSKIFLVPVIFNHFANCHKSNDWTSQVHNTFAEPGDEKQNWGVARTDVFSVTSHKLNWQCWRLHKNHNVWNSTQNYSLCYKIIKHS